MSSLQDLIMIAYRDPKAMDIFKQNIKSRQMDKSYQNQMDYGAAADYARPSLEKLLEEIIGQENITNQPMRMDLYNMQNMDVDKNANKQNIDLYSLIRNQMAN